MTIPIIFLRRERYVQLLIEDFQKQVLHVEVKQTLSKEEDIVLKKGEQKSNTYLDCEIYQKKSGKTVRDGCNVSLVEEQVNKINTISVHRIGPLFERP